MGFIHDILDVKVLILYVMAQVSRPVSAQTIYELCYQDEGLSYFDVQEAIPQMVVSGHLEEVETGKFSITEKGRETQAVTEDAVAYPVRERARVAIDRLTEQEHREKFLRTAVEKKEDGNYTVHLGLDDAHGTLMELSLMAPTPQQARRLESGFRKNADLVYEAVMVGLLEELED